MKKIRILSAKTEEGIQAIKEVMDHSYHANIKTVPPEWVFVRIVDDTPVSFAIVDPNRIMQFPCGDIPYAFVCDIATREDRRREGHFRELMEYIFSKVKASGISFVVLHGKYQLYRPFGFEVFTHHSGIFISPGSIEEKLGGNIPEGAEELLTFEDGEYIQNGLLLVTEVQAKSLFECKAVLQVAAVIARKHGKSRILFEHPTAPSYGSRYPIYSSPETPFTALARACGAEVRIQGANPESGSIPDADWIKVMDAHGFVKSALENSRIPDSLPKTKVTFDTDAGTVTIDSTGGELRVFEGTDQEALIIKWPSGALAQLVTGYAGAEILSVVHSTPLPENAITLLKALFPRCWRFSRNESWTF